MITILFVWFKGKRIYFNLQLEVSSMDLIIKTKRMFFEAITIMALLLGLLSSICIIHLYLIVNDWRYTIDSTLNNMTNI